MTVVLWLAVLLPVAGALATRLLRAVTGPIAVASALVSAAPAWALLAASASGEQTRSAFMWLPTAGLEFGLRLDALSAVMSATVASVGAVVVFYASGYFANDERAASALAGLLGFLAAMQGLVLADDYLTLLIFWEIVGALSARLIAFNRADPTAPSAAVRAFVITRSADVGLYLALLALHATVGSLAFDSQRPEGALGVLVGVGLVLAAMGKSAQAPFQTWLLGAMAGPTPVSALLHSATMVAAGVYLLTRSDALLEGWPLALVGWVGAVTAVVGAAIALAQDDLKRLLAGSTTSQLGLMFVGLAAGGPAVALFHLIAHAAGKATLFLAAGAFQHNRSSTKLSDLRGAGRDDRKVMAAFVVGALSIAAVPPLAGFWSKDAIAAASEQNPLWFMLVLLAGAGSAAYLLRPAVVLWRRAPTMALAARGRVPMIAGPVMLAAASVGLAFAGEPLADLLGESPPRVSLLSVALSLTAMVAGAAAVFAGRRVPSALVAAGRHLIERGVLERFVMAIPAAARWTAASVARADLRFIDGAVDGIGRGGVAAAQSQEWVERHGIDAAVDGLARLIGRGGTESRRLQSGRLHEYLRDTTVGAIAIATLIALTALF